MKKFIKMLKFIKYKENIRGLLENSSLKLKIKQKSIKKLIGNFEVEIKMRNWKRRKIYLIILKKFN